MMSVTSQFDCPSWFVHADEVTLNNCLMGLLAFTSSGAEWKQLSCIFAGGLPRVMNEQSRN
jgi:hypothetical protein